MANKFNYQSASTEEIVEQFLASSKQSIYNVRKYYTQDASMTDKLSQAYKLYRIAKIVQE